MADLTGMMQAAAGAAGGPTDPDFQYVTLLLTGDGTNGAQNNTFLDGSSNNFTITRNGNTTQGSFGPYGNLWSNYFDGSGDYLTVADNAALEPSNSDLTWEMWINTTSSVQYATLYSRTPTSFGSGMWSLMINEVSSTAGDVALYVANFSGGSPLLRTTGVDVRDGAWHHIAVVRSSSAWVLYVDGVSRATGTWSGTIADISGGPYIGRDQFYTRDYVGYISNLRIIKGTAVYTSAFTPPTAPLTAITNTSLLTCQSNRFIDNSTNNFTLTRNGDVSVQRFSPFLPSAAYDASVIGGSGYFDGSGDYLNTATNAAFALGTGDFTLECWIYATSTPSDVGIYEGRSTGVASNGFTLTAFSGSVIRIFSGSALISTSGTSYVNQWVHVAVTRQSGTTTLYVNGVSQGTSAASYNCTNDDAIVGGGRYSAGSTVTTSFPGYISNFRIVKGTAVYTSAFTPPTAPLTAITNTSLLTCQSNRFIDNSTNNFAITRNGDVSVQRFSPFAPSAAYDPSVIGGSGYFDGSGDTLAATANASFDISGDFTVEAWVYIAGNSTQDGSGNRDAGILGNKSSGGNGWYFNLSGDASITGTAVTFFATISDIIATANITIPQNSWNHFAISRSGSTTRIFFNGVSQTLSVNTLSNTSFGTGGTLYVGSNESFTSGFRRYLNGYIANARLIKGTALYTANFTPPTAPLTAITNTSLLLNFTNAGIIDNAMMNNLETVGDAQIDTSVKKFGTGSIEFDGTGDWLLTRNTPDLQFGTGIFTVEFWVYLASGDTGSNRGLIAKGGASTGWLVSLNTTEKVVFTYTTSTITSSGSINTNAWNHIAVVRQGTGSNQTKIYINGTNDGTGTVSTDFNQTENMYIGANRTGGDPMKGYIDDLRITKGIARYTANFTPPTAPFPLS